jgi:hypothetical protein
VTAAGPIARCSGALAAAALEGGKVVGFKAGERSIEHFPARHDHDVESGGHAVAPEDFTGKPFDTIAADSVSHLP